MPARRLLALAPVLAFAVALAEAARADAPEPPADPRTASPGPAVPEVPEVVEVEPKKWEFTVTAFGYDVASHEGYGYATLMADRGRLHLEARYGYEAADAASLWAGATFEFGKDLSLEVTPMVGAVLGSMSGVAVGYEATLSYGPLELYTEGEYVHDLDDDEGSYFYTWSELSVAPVEWFRVGLVVQRTKAYETDLDVQRGFLVGVTFDRVEVTAYVLNLGWTDPTLALSVSVSF